MKIYPGKTFQMYGTSVTQYAQNAKQKGFLFVTFK